MTGAEEGVVFPCMGQTLVGVLHRAQGPRGVLVLAGGPQYRAGSHRQFTLLGRRLAAEGVPVLRFDCRGYGDSSGVRAGFAHSHADVDAAVAAFLERCPGLREVVVCGLCDAVSALLLHPARPAAVRGMVLMNPWIRDAEVAPETLLRHYYLERLLSADFWRKLAAGGVGLAALRGLLGTAAGARRRSRSAGQRAGGNAVEATLAARMAAGLERFAGPVLLLTSGRDLVAAEFLDMTRRDPRWQALLARPELRHEHLADANHTFASHALRSRVEDLTLDWLRTW